MGRRDGGVCERETGCGLQDGRIWEGAALAWEVRALDSTSLV